VECNNFVSLRHACSVFGGLLEAIRTAYSDEGCSDDKARGFGDDTLRIRPNVTPHGADLRYVDGKRGVDDEKQSGLDEPKV
jgi:hypothetical protein